jgi:flavin reductase (DIM6/NTAB) family NADH-FMN oxidoreductase RutF
VPLSAGVLGPFPPGVDHDAYDRLRRKILWRIPAGIYLLGSRAGERRNLMTASLVTQLAIDPKLIGVSVETSSRTAELIEESGRFALSLLAREDRGLVRKFVKPPEHDRDAHTLAGVAYIDAGVTGSPIVSSALAWLDCEVRARMDNGSHVLFAGEVVDAGSTDEDAEVPLLRMEDTRMSYGG